jgi:hypothetical protein
MNDVDHRRLAADLYNHAWTLIDRPKRTPDEDDEMLYSTFASAYHWLRVEGAGPEHRARSEWQISRVYAELGRGNEAVVHARRCLDHCTEHGIGDWDLAFAWEALARASRVAGDAMTFDESVARARDAGAQIADAEDREHFERALAEIT